MLLVGGQCNKENLIVALLTVPAKPVGSSSHTINPVHYCKHRLLLLNYLATALKQILKVVSTRPDLILKWVGNIKLTAALVQKEEKLFPVSSSSLQLFILQQIRWQLHTLFHE